MYRLIVALGVLLVSYNFLCAQETSDRIRVSGQVLDQEDETPIPFVHIMIKSRNLGTATNQEGKFSIEISKDDTVLFGAVHYESKKITFADSIKKNYENLRIVLKQKIYTLDPVDITAYDLQEIFHKAEKDSFTIERERFEPLFERQEPEEKPTISVGLGPDGAALTGAITAFANLFNKEFKERKKLQKIVEQEQMQRAHIQQKRRLEQNYHEIAQKVTGLNPDDFDKFKEIYMPSFDFLMRASDYELLVKIHQDYKRFRYTYKLEELSLNELLENAKFSKD